MDLPFTRYEYFRLMIMRVGNICPCPLIRDLNSFYADIDLPVLTNTLVYLTHIFKKNTENSAKKLCSIVLSTDVAASF